MTAPGVIEKPAFAHCRQVRISTWSLSSASSVESVLSTANLDDSEGNDTAGGFHGDHISDLVS